jgi:flagellar biosynthesis GTPase FlhF
MRSFLRMEGGMSGMQREPDRQEEQRQEEERRREQRRQEEERRQQEQRRQEEERRRQEQRRQEEERWQQEQDRPRLRAFIAMPFATEFESVFQAIQVACRQANVEPVRADSIDQPGPIINQIFAEIGKADILIAEIGSRNSNVYYEVGLAHCVQLPSILVSRKDEMAKIPFDLSHNRIIAFEDQNLTAFATALKRSIEFVKETVTGSAQSFEDTVRDTSVGRLNIQDFVKNIGDEFGFYDPKLVESRSLADNKGMLVEIKDGYSDQRARFIYDTNGNIRDKRLVEGGRS